MINPLLAARLRTTAPLDEARQQLRPEQRRDLVGSLVAILSQLYTHLPQKRARYGIDPVQRLRLLGERAADTDLSDSDFHQAITRIFTDLRDAHTRYLPSGPANNRAAILPLLVERYQAETGTIVFVVSKVEPTSDAQARRFRQVGFEPGVVVTHWNAVPIDRAVSNYADFETAGRPDARLARALESLTIRPLRFVPQPDEEWVTISFTTRRGARREIRLEWQTVDLDDPQPDSGPVRGLSLAYNPTASDAQVVKKMLFATEVWAEEQAARVQRLNSRRSGTSVSRHAYPGRTDAAPNEGAWMVGDFASNVAARIVRVGSRRYGHLRIYSFQLQDDQAFINEVAKLVDRLPDRGLIVDVRSNPGGNVWAAEGLLQLFSPSTISPTLFSLVASDMTRAMARAPQNRHLDPWASSLEAAISSGATHSEPVALTPPALCNSRGQAYGGPVVLVVDANTYSAGDLFAAGFVDNRIGRLISTDSATGGGGANVWTSAQVLDALAQTPFAQLDLGGASFTLALRRASRYGPSRADIEDVGVEAQYVHSPTLRDLTDGNRDLLSFASRLIETEPRSSLHCDRMERTIRVRTSGLDVVQLEVDDGIAGVCSVADGRTAELALPDDWQNRLTAVAGFSRGQLRQRRRLNP